ncbi:electron transport complex subunit RsxC [Aromatoleum bremense]|uniref:Ion-translocating oxidoreductase complex subunit C n=1 Tax=Aromatoleum bremense TaxID=76115 RepID=A0ABX1NUG1_9RHOO|nr:electron transport complex subunit RsxC [Aromatoleum bremense]NMG15649.1 electron transport complex subunit RsxC [Aromatoleum bremense]QTQ30629.1 Electron transport complex, gamma subunit [Aromatoleum bremense]
MIARLFSFHGGIKPDSHKNESSSLPIAAAPLPPRLTIPLRQSVRSVARCLVAPGQRVLKGERIGAGEGPLGTDVHASTSGTVVGLAPCAMAHASGLNTLAVIIEPDGKDEWIERRAFDHHAVPREAALRYLSTCGIVGMGGAGFPTHIKLGNGRGIETLIINGAECEPWITCDDRLMRERAAEILSGAAILHELIGARRTLVGIEDNKPEAIRAMREAATGFPGLVDIVAIPTRYPAGGEKQLIRVLTGIEIAHGKLGTEFGVQCFNVGTAQAVHRAIHHGEPLVSRVVTLTGNVRHPGNYEVLVGTPVETLLALAAPKPDTDRYLMGGPMMGITIADLSVPIGKTSNCIIAASPALFPPPPPELPCIRCGACARACPADLQPFELYWFSRAKNVGKAQEYHLFDCIECGSCAFVCPSHIPLVDYFRFSKSEIWARERELKTSDQARERFEFRNYRQEREKEEKAAKLAAKAAETRAKLTGSAAPTDAATGDDPKKALIAAALARAKQQAAAIEPRNTDTPHAGVPGASPGIASRREQPDLHDSDATS